MNDVSVREINELYSFYSQINNFISGLDSVRSRLQSGARSKVSRCENLISRIERARERINRQINSLEASINSLHNSLYNVEDEAYRRYILDEIDMKTDEKEKLEDELIECENDMEEVQNRLYQARNLADDITQEAFTCMNEAKQYADNACRLLYKLIYHCKILKGNFMLEYGLLSQKQQELDSITSSLRNIWNDKQYEYFCNHLILPIKNCLQQHEVFISSKISSMEQIESQIESVASKY